MIFKDNDVIVVQMDDEDVGILVGHLRDYPECGTISLTQLQPDEKLSVGGYDTDSDVRVRFVFPRIASILPLSFALVELADHMAQGTEEETDEQPSTA